MPRDLRLILPFVTIDVTRIRNRAQNELPVPEAIAVALHDAETSLPTANRYRYTGSSLQTSFPIFQNITQSNGFIPSQHLCDSPDVGNSRSYGQVLIDSIFGNFSYCNNVDAGVIEMSLCGQE